MSILNNNYAVQPGPYGLHIITRTLKKEPNHGIIERTEEIIPIADTYAIVLNTL